MLCFHCVFPEQGVLQQEWELSQEVLQADVSKSQGTFFFLKFGDILWDRNDTRKAHQEADLQ